MNGICVEPQNKFLLIITSPMRPFQSPGTHGAIHTVNNKCCIKKHTHAQNSQHKFPVF
jgi:hypothetical protein